MNGIKSCLVVLVVIAMWGGLASTASCQELPDLPKRRVGEVIIIGNTRTPDWFIRRLLPFVPGEVVQYPLLRIAERDLARCGRFVVDADAGIRPTVAAIDDADGGPAMTITVTVQERLLIRPAMVDAAVISVRGELYMMRFRAAAVKDYLQERVPRKWVPSSEVRP